MPLDQTCSLDAMSRNISRSYKDGKTAKGTQHVAIGLSVLKKACGVPSDAKMTPKEIVAAGQKEEGVLFRMAALVERSGPDDDRGAWVTRLAEQAELAAKEAARGRRGPSTDALLKHLSTFRNSGIEVPTFESREHPGARAWTTWLARLETAARNGSLPGLTKVLSEFRNGRVAVPADTARLSERFIDFAVRDMPHGVGTSPSASPPEPKGSGQFMAHADGPEIVRGDGRAPKRRRSR